MKKRLLIFLCTTAVVAMCAGTLLWMYGSGIFALNRPADEYPVWGVDVSAYQGDIDWQTLSGQGVQFAFIKATEGSSFADPQYAANMAGAQQAQIPAGAYHFFSFDSAGDTQADNFIGVVGDTPLTLPPVIDVELYCAHKQSPPDAQRVHAELDVLIRRIEQQYGVKPILYSTMKAYRLYLAGEYEDCDIWIRNVFTLPALPDDRPWTFWQYSDKGRLQGYDGEEKFIDLNVFSGSASEFADYIDP